MIFIKLNDNELEELLNQITKVLDYTQVKQKDKYVIGVIPKFRDFVSDKRILDLFDKKVADQVGLWDEKYFMYFEDCDLGRKIQQYGYRTVYYPNARVLHHWERASYKNLRMTIIHIVNMCRYFNKWGWKFF